MSKIDKAMKKFYNKPIPNDITFDEVVSVMTHFGCILDSGGNHPKIVYPKLGYVILVPKHGKCVGEVYIKQLKDLLDMIREELT